MFSMLVFMIDYLMRNHMAAKAELGELYIKKPIKAYMSQ